VALVVKGETSRAIVVELIAAGITLEGLAEVGVSIMMPSSVVVDGAKVEVVPGRVLVALVVASVVAVVVVVSDAAAEVVLVKVVSVEVEVIISAAGLLATTVAKVVMVVALAFVAFVEALVAALPLLS